MQIHRSLMLATAGLIFMASCASVMKNYARTYEKEDLRPVIVGDRGYAVERRTRIVDLDKDPRAPGNKVVSVLANVSGTWVYCGVTRDNCADAIRRQLIEDSRNRKM